MRGRRGIATPAQRATYDVLHTAGLATEPLRAGLDPTTAAKAVRHLRTLVGASGLALLTGSEVLAMDGGGHHHQEQLIAAARKSLQSKRSIVLGLAELPCDRVDCVDQGSGHRAAERRRRRRWPRSPTPRPRPGWCRRRWKRPAG